MTGITLFQNHLQKADHRSLFNIVTLKAGELPSLEYYGIYDNSNIYVVQVY